MIVIIFLKRSLFRGGVWFLVVSGVSGGCWFGCRKEEQDLL